jgi:hypothetical protein
MNRHSDSGKQARFGEAQESSSVGFVGERLIPAGGVRWQGYSHRQMWDMIMRSRPAELFARADQWQAAATRLEEANTALQQRLNTLLTTWQGPAAEAAATSQQRLLNWAQEAAVRASTIGMQLANYGNALVSARQRMPQPQHRWADLSFRDGDGANALDGVAGAHLLLQMMSNRLPTAQQAREAKREAVLIMQELEGNAADAERGMPQFTSAPPTTDGEPHPGHWPPQVPVGPDPVFGQSPRPVEPFDVGTTTAQFAGDPVGYGPGESRGSLPHGGGAVGGQPGPLGGGRAAGELGVLGKGVGIRPEPFGVLGQGGPAAGHGSGPFPGAAGARSDGDEDTEKPLADYIEPDDIFKDDRPVYPPVWGV